MIRSMMCAKRATKRFEREAFDSRDGACYSDFLLLFRSAHFFGPTDWAGDAVMVERHVALHRRMGHFSSDGVGCGLLCGPLPHQ